MALFEQETVAAVAATAAALSPRVRRIARKGAVYGVAGILRAGDVVIAGARGVARATDSAQSNQTAGTETKPVRAAERRGPAATTSATQRSSSSRAATAPRRSRTPRRTS
jgi:hypothetical protein